MFKTFKDSKKANLQCMCSELAVFCFGLHPYDPEFMSCLAIDPFDHVFMTFLILSRLVSSIFSFQFFLLFTLILLVPNSGGKKREVFL